MKKLLYFFIIGLLTFGCVLQTAAKRPLISISKEIPGISKGILKGYLAKEELPNSLKLVSPPPEEGTNACALNQGIAVMYVASDDEARKEQAAKDAVLHFPEAMDAFKNIFEPKISKKATPPTLNIINRRTLADAGLSNYAARNYYMRERPSMLNNAPLCTPEEKEELRRDEFYLSERATIYSYRVLIQLEVFSEQADDLPTMEKEFGKNRNVCNVHWHNDVLTRRMMSTATVAKLHRNEDFRIDLAAAKEEIRRLKTL